MGTWRMGDLGLSLKPVLQSNEKGQRVVFDVEQSMSRIANSGSQLKRAAMFVATDQLNDWPIKGLVG